MAKKEITLTNCKLISAIAGSKAVFQFDDGSYGFSDGLVEEIKFKGSIVITESEEITFA